LESEAEGHTRCVDDVIIKNGGVTDKIDNGMKVILDSFCTQKNEKR